MKDRTGPTASDVRRALADRTVKGGAIESGAAKARVIKSRARKETHVAQPPSNAIVTRSSAYIAPHVREAMIAESAYFRSAHRGFEPGHEVDDWLAAESEIDGALARGDMSPLCG